MNDGWIPIDEYCERYGEKRGTINQRITDGHWVRGEMYAVPDGKAPFVHEARAVAWLEARRQPKEKNAA